MSAPWNTANPLDQARIYNDLNGLNAIKQTSKTNQDAALKEVARQFESMFVAQLLKSMREANDAMFTDNPFNSHEAKFYRQMYDDQLALVLSGQGMGLSESLYQQLKTQVNDQSAGLPGDIKPLSESDRSILPAVKINDRSQTSKADSSPLQPGEKVTQFASPEAFVRQLFPIAENIGRQAGLNPKTLLAQAALETGWGQKVMVDESGQNSHNLFGIKALRDWQGPVAQVQTLEHDGKGFKPQQQAFRSYESWEHSFQDYLQFLQSNPRYQAALRSGDNGEDFANALQQAGYATDPNYANKILGTLKKVTSLLSE